MKAAVVAALLAGGVSAHRAHNHRAHQALFEKRGLHNETAGTCAPTCTTIYTTITGAETWIQPPPKTTSAPAPPPPPPVVEVSSTTEAPVPVITATTTLPGEVVPTPIPQTCPTPGTYTFPATTIVVTETTTVCGATTTEVPAGTHTLGGVTTVVETATTVVCPVATTEVNNGVVTSVIKTTTFVCPTPGTYTIGPITTVVPSVTTVVVPVVTTFCPGTYTAPAVVTTITETNVVVYCPFTSSEIPAPTPQAIATSPAAPPPAAPPAPVKEKPSPVPAKPSPQPHKPSGGGLGGNGNLWAMTYTPFRADGHCKSAGEVMEDVTLIKKAGFVSLRIYSTDCDTLPNVGAAARANGLRLIIGIFIGAPGCDNGDPTVAAQIAALKAWKQWDLVDLCVVGNEALFNNFCTVQQLTNLIVHTKQELGSVGYTGKFTTTDVLSAFESRDVSSICNVIDVATLNAHPYFNYQTTPGQAGVFVKGQLSVMEKICGKKAYCMETGWPKAGVCNGAACPGVSQQREAIASIKKEVGNEVVFFSFRNDNWKEPGSCNCERSWGCGDVFGV
ncbi:glycoside hydrolase superfamily [Podospora australis]|uniref:Probable beta-glucosidase btgE n=1 Tax=Podospora australis TaxID=1536484 RepID=A0AAN6WZK2_9PEZI|nr:glycoside hydrolase superfamily [Podospora australis]